MGQKHRRVAFFDGRYNSFYGAQKSMLSLVTGLRSAGLADAVVVTTGKGEFVNRALDENCEISILPTPAQLNVFGRQLEGYSLRQKLQVIVALASYNLTVLQWLRRHRIDAVYANDARTLLYVGGAAKALRLPVIWYVREDVRLRQVHALSVRLASKVITIADGVRVAFTERELSNFGHKFETLYTGFDVTEFQSDSARMRIREALKISQSTRVVGLVGSITPRKGHDVLVQAIPAVLREAQNTAFVFVGDGPSGSEGFSAQLKAEIARLGVDAHVHWLGYQANIADIYSAMDLLVLPSRGEGLPRTLIEGLAAGLPVIASNVGGVGEIIRGEAQGKIINNLSADNMSDAILDVLRTQGFDNAEAKASRREYVEARFSRDAFVLGFSSILDCLLTK